MAAFNQLPSVGTWLSAAGDNEGVATSSPSEAMVGENIEASTTETPLADLDQARQLEKEAAEELAAATQMEAEVPLVLEDSEANSTQLLEVTRNLAARMENVEQAKLAQSNLTTCSEDEVALKPLTEDFDMQQLSSIKLIAADLDKTFYPNGMGDATSDPNPEAIDEFEKNIECFVEFMKNRGLAIPVTGNSPALAQGKFDRSQVEWNVEDHPGVFCNGALVLGAEGRVEYSAPVPVAVMRKLQEWVASCDGFFDFEGIKYPFAVNCMTKSKLLYLAPKKTSLESQQIAVGWASMQLTTSEVAEPECDWEAFPA
jgi:hypothetical protein